MVFGSNLIIILVIISGVIILSILMHRVIKEFGLYIGIMILIISILLTLFVASVVNG